MKRFLFGFFSLFLLYVAMSSTANASEILLNGGFENYIPPSQGDYAQADSWMPPPPSLAFSVPSLTYSMNNISSGVTFNPHSGNRLEVLAPGGLNDVAIWQSTSLLGQSSAKLSFWWRFQALDFDEVDDGEDRLLVSYTQNFSDDPSDWTTLWEQSLSVNPGSWVIGDWALVNLPIPVEAFSWEWTSFKFTLSNNSFTGGEYGNSVNQTGQWTTVFLDDVSLQAVPEPASILLLGTGLATLGLAVLWRKK